jgi:hypothetical protein
MRSRNLFVICFLALGLLAPVAEAGTYPLTDGSSLSGEPISYNEIGLIVRQSDGKPSPRTSWEKFTQDALKQLSAEAKSPKDKELVEAFIEESPEQQTKKREIVVKEVPTPARPTGNTGLSAGFSSPLFLFIFFILYLANLYAAYEIAFYKNQLPLLVCGVSAVAPFIGPIIFLLIPAKADPTSDQQTAAPAAEPIAEEIPVAENAAAPVSETAPDESNPLAPQTPVHSSLKIAHHEPPPTASFPAPIVFRRAEFSFNRRFFETKMPGFFRVVPGEAEKNLVLVIKAMRGEFVGKRITRVTQAELYLQVFKDEATHDEMIPFTEIQEITIRHKDAA